MIALAFALSLAHAGAVQRGAAHEPPRRTVLVDNATVTVTRLRFAPHAREDSHRSDSPLLIVQLTPGDVDVSVGDVFERGAGTAGAVTFVPAGVGYRAENTGAAPIDMLTIAINPARAAAPAAPPSEPPPHITRTTPSSTTTSFASSAWCSSRTAKSRCTATQTTS